MNNSGIFTTGRFHAALILFLLSSEISYPQSKAHDSSRFAVIDPAYRSDIFFPQPEEDRNVIQWVYGPAELECMRLQLFQRRKDSARLIVGYPGVFHIPSSKAEFRLKRSKPMVLSSLNFRATGHGRIYINDVPVTDFGLHDFARTIILPAGTKVSQIRFEIITSEDLPALLVLSNGISTSDKGWEWKSDETGWETATHYPQNIHGVPPHMTEDPVIRLEPETVNGNLIDFGKELFGYLVIHSSVKPAINVGESIPEAEDTTKRTREQHSDIVRISGNVWKTSLPQAFRYVYMGNSHIDSIWSETVFRPEVYRGAFACSDSLLTKIWMNSAYTLRLCMHDFLLDGVKRDRLPWAGDLAMSLLVNAYSFGDRDIVRRSLVALGRAGIKEKDINGIVDYSLWWIISQNQYQLYYNDPDHLRQEWGRIKETLKDLSLISDQEGFLVPGKDAWLFIDWVDQEKWTALQILWWWAQKSGASLALRKGDRDMAELLEKNAGKLKISLLRTAWCNKEQIWLSGKGTSSEKSRYPNFLAVVSGLSGQDQYPGIRKLLEGSKAKPVGTPYMAGFEDMALSQLGNTSYMMNHVKDYWGAMLLKGATTFWEAYNPAETGKEQYAFYDRPYAKSLCHAWSSGPAAFLPMGIFGLNPLEDGWKRFTLHPDPGSLSWASICVPTEHGNITADIVDRNIRINVPEGTTLEWKGKSIKGPGILDDRF